MKTLKSKILAGLFFLLILILSISLTGIISIYYLSSDSNEIIKDNYASLEYCQKMLSSIEKIFNDVVSANSKSLSTTELYVIRNKIKTEQNEFEKNLSLQKNNITEPGEKKLVTDVVNLYSKFSTELNNTEKSYSDLTDIKIQSLQNEYLALTQSIREIYDVNNKAVYTRSKIAHKTADKVSLVMAIVTAVSIVLTIAFIFYFPSYLTFPILELTKKIDDISNRKYDQRIEIKSNDEFRTLADAFNKMTFKLKEYEEQHIDELILEKRRIETLVANLQDGSLLLDNDFSILHANNKFCELTGLSVSKLIGKKIFELENKNEITDFFSTLNVESIKDNHSLLDKKIRVKSNDHSEYYKILLLEISRSFKSEVQKEISGYILLIQNITSFEERDIAKTNLLATISHELKTPLSSINLSLKLLEDDRIGSLNSEQKELVQSIKQHSARILKLVNEVLDFTQAETGQIKLKISEHNINDIIEFGTFAVLMLLNEKEIDLKVLANKDLPKVKCDIEKTVWVIVNLLTNAIRYSEKKGRIIISAERTNNYLQFSIRDFGSGISEEEQNRIFEKYVTSSSRSAKGTGLGLAIAKEFVEVQGGQISFTSELNKGTTFYFTLPIA